MRQWPTHKIKAHPSVFFLLHHPFAVSQLVLSPVLLLNFRFAAALSALLYTAAIAHYWYIVFLGYSTLPFLQRPECFLYPCVPLIVFLPAAVVLGFNPTKVIFRLFSVRPGSCADGPLCPCLKSVCMNLRWGMPSHGRPHVPRLPSIPFDAAASPSIFWVCAMKVNECWIVKLCDCHEIQ